MSSVEAFLTAKTDWGAHTLFDPGQAALAQTKKGTWKDMADGFSAHLAEKDIVRTSIAGYDALAAAKEQEVEDEKTSLGIGGQQ